ncbi:MAG TPA: class I SAM-dependent methyltransferase [Gaiellaceae bacterium]|nr:class I SAM-dependent methyltransferase [Gaiellaceae bacterium]
MPTVQELYELWAGDEYSDLKKALDQSREPRGAEWLFELFAGLGPKPGQTLLDVGARDAKHAIRLEQEHGLRVTALDPLPLHCERARQAVAEAGADVEVVEGRAEELPLPDGSVDWIWCRDVLSHLDLRRALAEFARVLTPGGSAVVYVTVPTERLDAREAAEMVEAAPLILRTATEIERAADGAGLVTLRVERIGSEWRERMVEDGDWDAVADLLRLARLERRRDELVERYGAVAVDAARNGFLWGVYQLLGKLCPTVYVWERRA